MFEKIKNSKELTEKIKNFHIQISTHYDKNMCNILHDPVSIQAVRKHNVSGCIKQ